MGSSTPAPARQGQSYSGMEDVEMRWNDSPARQDAGPSQPLATGTETHGAEKENEKDTSAAQGEERPMARGAVSRVRKKRQKEWRKSRRDSVSTNGDGVSPGLLRLEGAELPG